MAFDPPQELAAINEIRDSALLLSVGNEYLCDQIFLKKIGLSIALNAKELKSDIASLKKKRPERFKETQTDEALSAIFNTAQRMLNPDKETSEKCVLGQLGRELEASINYLARAVNAVTIQAEERAAPRYPEIEAAPPEATTLEVDREEDFYPEIGAPATDLTVEVERERRLPPVARAPMADLRREAERQWPRPAYPKPEPLGWLTPIGNLFVGFFILIIKTLKIFLLFILIAIFPFIYLVVTMESASDIEKEIGKSVAYIEVQQNILSELHQEEAQLSRRVESMTGRELTRQEMIETMDLNMKIYELTERRQRIGAEIGAHAKKMADYQRKIDELKKKSFLQRLLRR
jgi:peptidoglycan hydrolase CwlO-like protein